MSHYNMYQLTVSFAQGVHLKLWRIKKYYKLTIARDDWTQTRPRTYCHRFYVDTPTIRFLFFTETAPLGRFSFRVAMSVCLCVCAIRCIFLGLSLALRSHDQFPGVSLVLPPTRKLGNLETRKLGNSETQKLRNKETQELRNSETRIHPLPKTNTKNNLRRRKNKKKKKLKY